MPPTIIRVKKQHEVRGFRESQAEARKARKIRGFRESLAEARKAHKTHAFWTPKGTFWRAGSLQKGVGAASRPEVRF